MISKQIALVTKSTSMISLLFVLLTHSAQAGKDHGSRNNPNLLFSVNTTKNIYNIPKTACSDDTDKSKEALFIAKQMLVQNAYKNSQGLKIEGTIQLTKITPGDEDKSLVEFLGTIGKTDYNIHIILNSNCGVVSAEMLESQ